MKDLNHFQKYEKKQEASYNFKLDFALSNRPHFNSVYIVRVPFLTGIAVLFPNRLEATNLILRHLMMIPASADKFFIDNRGIS